MSSSPLACDPGATRATLALSAVAVVWGSTFVLAKGMVTALPVSSLLFWRFTIAAVVLVAVRPRALASAAARDRWRGLVAGLVLALGFALQTQGLQHTSASVSGFLSGMFVVLTPAMSGLLFRQRIATHVWWGVALTVVGLALLSLRGLSVGLGETETLLAALSFAVVIALLGAWSTSQNAYGMTLIQVGVVALVGFLLTVLDGGPQLPGSFEGWAQLAFLGVVASALAFGVLTWAQSRLPATRTAVVLSSELVWAGIAGVVVAGDAVTVRLVLGGAFIFVAMYVVELGAYGVIPLPRRWPSAGGAGGMATRLRTIVRADPVRPRRVATAVRRGHGTLGESSGSPVLRGSVRR